MKAAVPNRASHVRLPGGLLVLVALLLAMLQAGMPCAHALLHVAAARTQVHGASTGAQPEFSATLADERACPLCTTDHVSALPAQRPAETLLRTVPAYRHARATQERSSQPLEIFCRPPPAA